MKKLAALLCVAGIVGCAMVGWASPATGVTPTVLSRATFDPFHLNRDPHSLVEFEARAKSPLDFVVRQHDYLPHSSTGWHSHPGPVFIYGDERHVDVLRVQDDPTCSAKIVDAKHGYVDTGRGHIGLNETDEIAQDISVILAPVGMGFRSELAAPSPYCGF